MDIATLPLTELETIARRLQRCADEIDALAARARHGTSPSWRGVAADRHSEIVAGHVSDLRELGDGLREAAVRVRRLAEVARHRAVRVADTAETLWDLAGSAWDATGSAWDLARIDRGGPAPTGGSR